MVKFSIQLSCATDALKHADTEIQSTNGELHLGAGMTLAAEAAGMLLTYIVAGHFMLL